jgi:hypothetical protein
MAYTYTTDVIGQLEKTFADCRLKRPMRRDRYEDGTELIYTLEFIEQAPPAQVKLRIERFVGGGFAGQVYRIQILSLTQNGQSVDSCASLTVGNTYAMKILIPPSGLGCLFRNTLYAIGFQGSFQLQVNPTAAKAGALWQKFIQHAATARFNDDKAVNNVHAILVDTTLGSCGEISDWVEGRTWRLEVDDHMDILKLWCKKRLVEHENLNSPEFRAKYQFMHEFVDLLHEMGAHEFARQYEWTTCKSQPNALKRLSTGDDPKTGLTAVDFRAGLTLLPFLPMSPGDFKLIGQGLMRGSLVQFDRGDIVKLEQFISYNPNIFSSMPNCAQMLGQLKDCETVYRNSVPDITHNHIRLLYDGNLWRTIFQHTLKSWRVRNLMEESMETVLTESKIKFAAFWLLGLIPLLGRFLRKFWGRADYREHYTSLFNFNYLRRAFRGHILEALIAGYRKGRFNETMTKFISDYPLWYLAHIPLLILPAGLHRFITDWEVFCEKIHFLFVRPFKLYFNKDLRSQWLRDMVAAGQKKHILSDDDAQTILAQVDEPYIQKYLVSLVVHLMTLPVTQLVSGTIALWYYYTHPQVPQAERAAMAAGILVLFQIIPMSPGSLCRGLYTTYMAVKDKNFKDYNIALFLSYFKYVGYLAFPIQMTYRYPSMARFMASHWATDAVHIVPVFGERGALLERWVFGLCYNWPLTIRRRMASIADARRYQDSNYWHLPVVVGLTWSLLIALHQVYHVRTGLIPSSDNFWYLKKLWPFLGPILCGWFVAVFAGGMPLVRRIISAAVCGACTAVAYSIGAFYLEKSWYPEQQADFFLPLIWRTFAFIIFSTIFALIRELRVQDPDWKYL